MINHKSIFHNLFVLELANNHWGSVDRGKKIINDHAQIVRYNNVKAAIKLQFRDVDSFIHHDYKGNTESRYIKKTEDTKLDMNGFLELVSEIKNVGCIPMATPFDEKSVDLCEKFEFPIIKVASSDCADWPLIERIASTRKPTIISTGGVSEKDLDDVVKFFKKRNLELAINHCVSLYPSEDNELCLSQIDYLRERYPNNIIGFSTHEYHDWSSSLLISYAKGVRTWERHVDIDFNNIPVSKYCSIPEQVDVWFKAFNKAKEMSGESYDERRLISNKETEYLDKLVRGVYCKRSLEKGYKITQEKFEDDFYLAIPLHKGQLSCKEILNGIVLNKKIEKDLKLTIDDINGPYSESKNLKDKILNRGI